MIRPRTGGFCYSKNEISTMGEEIRFLSDFGIKGVVFGCLDKANRIDKSAFESLLEITKGLGLESTFRRAIDFCSNKSDALCFLENIGVDRILTAGSITTVDDGYEGIKNIIDYVSNRVKL